MPLPRAAFACALAAGALSSLAVAGQRVGAALSLTLLLILATAVLSSDRRASPLFVTIAGALALQPVLRDAGWVVALTTTATLVAAAAAVVLPDTWRRVGTATLTPMRLIGGSSLIARAAWAAPMKLPGGQIWPVVRGLAAGLTLATAFGALFATADEAFADLVDRSVPTDLDTPDLGWRLGLGLFVLAVTGAIARSAMQPHDVSERTPVKTFGRVELLIALAAVIAVFSAFVAVQLHVLFGGAQYVQKTTGLGYGDYARQGFVELLFVVGLTLGVVAMAARHSDRSVRALLAVLCLLTLVILGSAYHRLGLVEDAYGLTRVRYLGNAVILWFVAIFGLVMAAGLDARAARAMPAVATALTLAGVLVFSLSNPDGRIAASAVTRAEAGKSIDACYLSGLSADALPELNQLPMHRGSVLSEIHWDLERPDSIAGANLSRARARSLESASPPLLRRTFTAPCSNW